jgi:uncharacterized membrane protein
MAPVRPSIVGRWSSLLLVGGLVLALLGGWWAKASCISDGHWDDGEQYSHACYTDYVALWHGRGLKDGKIPYLDEPVEYPVVQGAVMWLTAEVVRAAPGTATARNYVDANAALTAVLLVVALVLLRRIGVVLPALGWWAGLPVVALTAFINWDAVPVVLTAAAILLHQRERDGWSGLFVGLGTAAKLYPGFLLPLIVVERVRQGRVRGAAVHVLAAGATWLVLNLPVAMIAPHNWNRFLELNRERERHVDSLWYALDWLGGPALRGTTLNVAGSGVFLAGVVVILVVGARGRVPQAPLWPLMTPVLIWFLLTNKVYSPQYSLWVVALLIVTLRRAAPFVAFAVADVAVNLTEFAVLGGRAGFDPAPSEGWLVLATVIRAAVLLWIAGTVLRDPSLGLGERWQRGADDDVRRHGAALDGVTTPVA